MPAYFLVEIAVKASVVLLGAWGATWLMTKRTSAAARHFVWTAAVAALLCLPALVLFGPAWRVAEVPDRWVPTAQAALRVAGLAGRADGEVWPEQAPVSSHAPVSPVSVHRTAPSTPVQRMLGSTAGLWPAHWPSLIVSLWVGGVAIGLCSLIAGLAWAWWLVRRSVPVTTPAWVSLQAEAAALLGVRRPVSLRMSERIAVPVACGIVRASLLLPRDADAWDEERRRIVLLHELAHVQRRDCLVQAMAHLAWVIHWFNPLAVLAISRLRLEQESACDDLVLVAGMKPADYAHHLIEIAAKPERLPIPVWAALAIARRSRLEARVTAILDSARSRRLLSLRSCLAVAFVTGFIAVPLGAVRASLAVQAIELLPSAAVGAIAPYTSFIPDQHGLLAADVDPAAEFAAVVAAAPPAQELTAENARAFLQTCLGCHNATRKVANLLLDTVNPEAIGEHPELWERVVRKLRSGTHVSVGAAWPSRAASDAFAASVEAALDRAAQAAGGPTDIVSQRELATRIAKFLWNTEPDDTLMTLANRGTLTNHANLQEQVRRMLRDARSTAFLTAFFGDWLHLKNLAKVNPSAVPDFDEELRDAFQRETELFLANQIRDDHPAMDLLTANYTFLNERLARHYGIDGIKGSEFRRVTLRDGVRAGLLGHGSVLTVTSFPTRTSPVVRGKYVMELFLGANPPNPPANVPAMSEDATRPVRQRLEQHRKNPACSSCHNVMDPLGFALENFDNIGRWRDTDSGAAVDASGTFPDGSRFAGPAQLRDWLVDRRDAIVRTLTLKLLSHAAGRPAHVSDMPAVRAVVWEAGASNYKWSSLVLGVLSSAPFQQKRLE